MEEVKQPDGAIAPRPWWWFLVALGACPKAVDFAKKHTAFSDAWKALGTIPYSEALDWRNWLTCRILRHVEGDVNGFPNHPTEVCEEMARLEEPPTLPKEWQP